MRRLVKTVFFMLLSIMGLSFMTYALTIAVFVATGRLTGEQLRNMLRVMGGHRYYVVDSPDYHEYQAFVLAKREADGQATLEYGDPGLRAGGLAEAEGMLRQLNESRETALRELESARRDVERVRGQNQTLEREVERQRRLFQDRVAREAAVREAEQRRNFQNIIPNMDEAALAADMAAMDPFEAARWVREFMPADFAAEVLGAMPPDIRRRVLPLVENQNAGVDPRLAARHMSQRLEIEGTYAMSPGEIYAQLARMNAPQAMATYLFLPAEIREQLEPLMQSGR